MTRALDGETLGLIIEKMSGIFTLEGAIYWLLGENPDFRSDDPSEDGRSGAWMLLNDEEEAVLQELEVLKALSEEQPCD